MPMPVWLPAWPSTCRQRLDMRTLAIGDIHGCLTALDALLVLVDPLADDLLIALGEGK